MSFCLYLWAKKNNKDQQMTKLWPTGFLFISCSVYLLSFLNYPQVHFRQILSFSLIFIWSTAVFIHINKNLKARSEGTNKKDKNFGFILRMNFFQLIVAAPIFSIHFIPGQNSIKFIDFLAFTMALLGIYIQNRSNRELRVNNPKNLICYGRLRQACRHPNALGEVIFWFSIYLIALNSVNGYMSFYGPLALIIFLLKVVLPKKDIKLENNFRNFKEYKSSSWMLLPKIK
tara:strand:- start:74 stop:763 length:690 start_codon:yes stop_codon:yes gene_type:complete